MGCRCVITHFIQETESVSGVGVGVWFVLILVLLCPLLSLQYVDSPSLCASASRIINRYAVLVLAAWRHLWIPTRQCWIEIYDSTVRLGMIREIVWGQLVSVSSILQQLWTGVEMQNMRTFASQNSSRSHQPATSESASSSSLPPSHLTSLVLFLSSLLGVPSVSVRTLYFLAVSSLSFMGNTTNYRRVVLVDRSARRLASEMSGEEINSQLHSYRVSSTRAGEESAAAAGCYARYHQMAELTLEKQLRGCIYTCFLFSLMIYISVDSSVLLSLVAWSLFLYFLSWTLFGVFQLYADIYEKQSETIQRTAQEMITAALHALLLITSWCRVNEESLYIRSLIDSMSKSRSALREWDAMNRCITDLCTRLFDQTCFFVALYQLASPLSVPTVFVLQDHWKRIMEHMETQMQICMAMRRLQMHKKVGERQSLDMRQDSAAALHTVPFLLLSAPSSSPVVASASPSVRNALFSTSVPLDIAVANLSAAMSWHSRVCEGEYPDSVHPGRWWIEKMRYAGAVSIQADNVEFQQGAFVALIGQSGRGKTTLISALLDLLTDSTRSDLSLRGNLPSLSRGEVALVEQHPKWLPKRCVDNLTYGCKEKKAADILADYLSTASQSELDDCLSPFDRDSSCGRHLYLRLRCALAAAQISDLFPDTSSLLARRDNVSFSGGQLQRLNLARALFSCRSSFVLDEATHGLDPQTIYTIVSTLMQIAHGNRARARSSVNTTSDTIVSVSAKQEEEEQPSTAGVPADFEHISLDDGGIMTVSKESSSSAVAPLHRGNINTALANSSCVSSSSSSSIFSSSVLGPSILFVTHDMSVASRADFVAVIEEDGRLICDTQEIMANNNRTYQLSLAAAQLR